MKYRTKPFMINAYHWTGQESDLYNLLILAGTSGSFLRDITIRQDPDRLTDLRRTGGVVYIEVYDYLQDTWVKVNTGDYIIRGMKGEFYPCEQEVFEAKYEVYDSDSE